ncbi:hypothetical protein GCM10028805_29440 [Spirosoma harenae]
MQLSIVAYTSRWVFIGLFLSNALLAKAQFTSRIDCFFPAAWEGKETKLIVRPLDKLPIIDTAVVTNRRVTFSVNTPDLSSAYIWIEGNQDDVHFLIDSPNITIAFDPQASVQTVISGSSSSELWNEQREALHQLSEASADYKADFLKTNDSADSLYLAYQGAIAKLIDTHPTAASSWFLFASNYTSFPYRLSKQLFDKFASFSFYPSYQKIAKNLLAKQPGKKAIDFTLSDLYDRSIQLSQLNSQYILLDFSSSHMISCQQRHKLFKGLYKQYHAKGLEIITLSREFNKQAGSDQLKKEELPWPVIVISPENFSLFSSYVADRVPDNLLLDQSKTIRYRDLSIHELTAILEEKLVK